MKRCYVCKELKSEEGFPLRSQKTGRRHNRCKICQQKYSKAHYKKNSRAHNKRRYTNNKQYRERNRQFVIEYLRCHPCVDCGESDPVVLEFDHLRDKRMAVSKMVSDGFSIHAIEQEIEKCEVRCANCHRRKTARNRSWLKYTGT
jgi:hypothetical protein